jgi:TonB family protein
MLFAIIMIALLTFNVSCEQEKVDPALVLDEVLVPKGYHQADNPPADALARLQELRLENPADHYYYLQRENINSENWIFPQKELKIEYVDSDDTNSKSDIQGLIVKKIKGNWRDEEFTIADSQPAPKEGMKEFYSYITSNLKYPEQARRMGIEGKVFVEFVVDKDGKLIEVKAIKGIGAGCDQEAVRVIKEAEAWVPAAVVDVPVKTKMILPISFKLS